MARTWSTTVAMCGCRRVGDLVHRAQRRTGDGVALVPLGSNCAGTSIAHLRVGPFGRSWRPSTARGTHPAWLRAVRASTAMIAAGPAMAVLVAARDSGDRRSRRPVHWQRPVDLGWLTGGRRWRRRRMVEALRGSDERSVHHVVAGCPVFGDQAGVGHAQRLGDPVVHFVGPGVAGDLLDDLAEDDVVGVRVVVRTAWLADPSGFLGNGDQLGRRPMAQGIVEDGGLVEVLAEPTGVLEQLTRGDPLAVRPALGPSVASCVRGSRGRGRVVVRAVAGRCRGHDLAVGLDADVIAGVESAGSQR